MLFTWIIPILVFLAVVLIGTAIALVIARRKNMTWRVVSDNATGGITVTSSASNANDPATIKLLSKLGRGFSVGKNSNALREKLARAGFYGEQATTTFFGVKLMLFLVGLVVSVMLVMSVDFSMAAKIYLVMMIAAIMFFAPNFYIARRLTARKMEVKRTLPDAIDLLEICVSSGMGLDQAWNSVGDEIRIVSPVLADEMALANLELQLGATRAEALRHMSDRTGAEEFASLVAMLVQSERFGTSVSEALSIFAKTMRETRSNKAEESAEKMAVKLLFPLVLCIFPVMLIVMAGPACLTIMKIMSK